MNQDKLYRLLDIVEDLEKMDKIISLHISNPSPTSEMMISQYSARRNQLLVYLINELNTTTDVDETPQRLLLIGKVIERFHPRSSDVKKQDPRLNRLEKALS